MLLYPVSLSMRSTSCCVPVATALSAKLTRITSPLCRPVKRLCCAVAAMPFAMFICGHSLLDLRVLALLARSSLFAFIFAIVHSEAMASLPSSPAVIRLPSLVTYQWPYSSPTSIASVCLPSLRVTLRHTGRDGTPYTVIAIMILMTAITVVISIERFIVYVGFHPTFLSPSAPRSPPYGQCIAGGQVS